MRIRSVFFTCFFPSPRNLETHQPSPDAVSEKPRTCTDRTRLNLQLKMSATTRKPSKRLPGHGGLSPLRGGFYYIRNKLHGTYDFSVGKTRFAKGKALKIYPEGKHKKNTKNFKPSRNCLNDGIRRFPRKKNDPLDEI